MSAALPPIKVFVFPAAWGLPTSGPFALKLEAWLRMAGIPYERVYEFDPRKGPKGKNPWIEIGGQAMGDSELIIRELSRRSGRNCDAHLSARDAAASLAVKRLIEDHLHQIFEWELLIHESGWREMQSLLQELPPVVRTLVGRMMRRNLGKQLYARGIARHAAEDIAEFGRQDIDALVGCLGDGPYLFGLPKPSSTDASFYGMVAPMVFSPIDAPVMSYARAQPALVAYCERIKREYFDAPAREAAA